MSHKANAETRVIIGISGGVDSSVAALLLKQQGYQVQGVFMQNWQPHDNDPYCTADQDIKDAKSVCDLIKIPLEIANFADEYWQRVFQNFLDEYAEGRTPNPDILCNKEIKFHAFLDYALKNNADFIATGHYARKRFDNSNWKLLKAIDAAKDQSYFLYTLGQKQLQHSLFPIGDLKKTEVRAIAHNAKLINHAKKDSTGICFIGERKFKKFLNEFLLAKPGDIFTTDGKIIGKHDGIMFYTLGQRQGLGIGGKKNGEEKPWYVVKKDIENNRIYVAQEHSHSWLMSKSLLCNDIHWTQDDFSQIENFKCGAKIRYRQADQICKVAKETNATYRVEFAEPQRAITPGQSIVFYKGEQCLGGGIIC